MSRVERIEKEITELSPDELEDFRAWFATFDAARWDREIERDAGALNGLAEQALADHRAGRTKPL